MVAGLAVREGAPVARPDMLADPRVVLHDETRALAERSTHRAVLAVPLTIGGRVTGVLAVGDARGTVCSPTTIRDRPMPCPRWCSWASVTRWACRW
jgi:GAF domain-containing protein